MVDHDGGRRDGLLKGGELGKEVGAALAAAAATTTGRSEKWQKVVDI